MSARFRGRWERALRDSNGLSKGVKGTAFLLATYGNDDGTNIRPGHARLAENLPVTERCIKKNIAELILSGWLVKVRNGSLCGTRGAASIYRLALPGEAVQAPFKAGPGELEFTHQGNWSSSTGGTGVPPTGEVIQGKNVSSALAPLGRPVAAATRRGDDVIPEFDPNDPDVTERVLDAVAQVLGIPDYKLSMDTYDVAYGMSERGVHPRGIYNAALARERAARSAA